MNFLKSLFTSYKISEEEQNKIKQNHNFETLKYDGVKAMRMGQAEYAEKCFINALNIKEDLEIRDYLSQILLQTNKYEDAYKQLDIIANNQPDNEKIYIRQTNIAYIMENYEKMILACQKAMNIDKNNHIVYYLLACAYKGLLQHQEAISMLTKTIEIKPNFYEAILLRAKEYIIIDKKQEADEDIDILLKNLSNDEDVILLKANIECIKDNLKEAETYYSKAIEINPFSLEAYKQRADIRNKIGKNKEASDDLNTYNEIKQNMDLDIQNKQNIEQEVRNSYQNIDPYGIFGNK